MPREPQLHFEVRDGKGPFLLLVHGMFSDRNQWEPNIDALSAVSRPVLVELWGHGRSPAPKDPGYYTAAAYSAQFERIRESLGAKAVFICAQSFSAGLALRYGMSCSERVLGQVFTNSISALAPSSRAGSAEARELQAQSIEHEGHAALERIPYHPIHVRRLPANMKDRLLEAAAAVDPVGIANAIRITGPELSVSNEVGRISRPTLLVNGEHEKAFQPYRDEIARNMPHCRIVDLPAGHAVNLEVPESFDTAVSSFIADVMAGSRDSSG